MNPRASETEVNGLEKDENSHKLGTFSGVFIPTSLNVLSILMFLRFGFILGQMGILGTMLLLVMSYTIDLLTTLSISAIATNGTVRGGGAYYMISRSLGPEFGGSIGLVFYFGQVFNSALNVVGFIEPLLTNLGKESGTIAKILPEGYWHEFIYSSVLLFLCICVALVGSQLVSKAGSLLFVLLLLATVSIPVSTLFVRPFLVEQYGIYYTGPSIHNIKENLLPHFTKGAAGSLLKTKETFNDLFGIFFPATAGIFAGASMSGDLKKPSQSIPKGTLWGLLLTFICYSAVILSLGAAAPRDLLHKDLQIIQTINLSSTLVLIGEFSTSLFSVIVGIVGAANVLQAIAKDSIFPMTGSFAKMSNNNPINAIIVTWILCQLCLFSDINEIATYISMAFLMTFIVTNIACFLLKIASAPNFRPSFKFFDWYTALAGLVTSVIAMFIVDGISASIVVIFLIALFIFIHYISPPKSWGDVSQSLIYHQVRKYLLRLRQDNAKYWRPQILLLVDSPRSSWNLIQFCNNLKKGGLYILGHVIITESFQNNFEEFKKQQNAWLKLRDLSKIKAFVQIGLGPTLPWGVRNVTMGSGLGGMKPNITILGFYDLKKHYPAIQKKRPQRPKKKHSQQTINIEKLPTDECRNEKRVSIQNWVSIIEDLILMKANVAVAKGFEEMTLPTNLKNSVQKLPYEQRKFIDLYPIQMSAEVFDKNGERSAMTTNFDTYTLILQLGAILTTVPNWKKTHRLRIVVFVEDEEDIANEKERVESLIEVLRIKAVILVVCLKDFEFYNYLVKGIKNPNSREVAKVDQILEEDEWWIELQAGREQQKHSNDSVHIDIPAITISAPFVDFNEDLQNKKYGLSKLQKMGLSLSMTTNKLHGTDFHRAIDSDSDAESSYEDDTSSTYSQSLKGVQTPEPRLQNVSNGKRKEQGLYNRNGLDLNSEYGNNSKHSLPPQHIYESPSTAGSKNQLNKKSASVTALNKINKLKSNQKPQFSSEKIPRSRVIDDATGDEPSIMLVPDDDNASVASKKVNFSNSFAPKSGATSQKKPSRLNDVVDPLEPVLDSEKVGKLESPAYKQRSEVLQEVEEETQGVEDEEDEEEEGLNINNLSFNDLPAKGQHLILNNLMKTVSSDVPLIFTTLPAPFIGTHRDEEDCKEYLDNLQIWIDDLPPVLLINSQSMTVTTAL
jgi:potassium/chloride transporter 9